MLGAQSRLILQIARIYYQWPTLRDLISLYSNVAATAFVAGELEDMDIAEQILPIVAAAFGSAAGAVPGSARQRRVFIDPVTTGAENAFRPCGSDDRGGVLSLGYEALPQDRASIGAGSGDAPAGRNRARRDSPVASAIGTGSKE